MFSLFTQLCPVCLRGYAFFVYSVLPFLFKRLCLLNLSGCVFLIYTVASSMVLAQKMHNYVCGRGSLTAVYSMAS